MRLMGHGGACCGIRHIAGFQRADTKADLEALVARTAQHQTQGILIEAVLTNRQLKDMPHIAQALQEVGFNLVSRFKNPNSGNICNVFHLNSKPRNLTGRLPYRVIARAE